MRRELLPSYNWPFSINTKKEMWKNKEEDENTPPNENIIDLENENEFHDENEIQLEDENEFHDENEIKLEDENLVNDGNEIKLDENEEEFGEVRDKYDDCFNKEYAVNHIML